MVNPTLTLTEQVNIAASANDIRCYWHFRECLYPLSNENNLMKTKKKR